MRGSARPLSIKRRHGRTPCALSVEQDVRNNLVQVAINRVQGLSHSLAAETALVITDIANTKLCQLYLSISSTRQQSDVTPGESRTPPLSEWERASIKNPARFCPVSQYGMTRGSQGARITT